ncbi:hypothetical protein [Streptomyces sp. SP18BB07]|uniref:hypothetical protein n=1 Tax=Streptomyces sp. SP18BB07 TaxID=3002522 RepID=UPI002E77F76F|nr:hypothetical protein [Streptomyces sp. SP18BB07]MEE1764580.1 hypothetical protein [Streptomyces sp. SP18BB07]
MVLLAFLAVDTHIEGPDLSGGMTALGGVLLGLVMNPTYFKNRELFVLMVLAPVAVGVIATWKLFTVQPDHPSAGLVVATCLAIFAGLFVNTSNITQP